MLDPTSFIIDALSKLKASHQATISGETSLMELELDSLDILELVMAIEDRFHVELDPADLGTCRTVADIATLVGASRRSA